LRATTMHRRLYDLDLQLEDIAQAGVDVSVLSCLLGWSAPLEECRFINDDTGKGMVALKNYIDAVRDLPLTQKSKDEIAWRHRGGAVEAVNGPASSPAMRCPLFRDGFGGTGFDVARLVAALRFHSQPTVFFFDHVEFGALGNFCDYLIF
jgi:hypothetical protein